MVTVFALMLATFLAAVDITIVDTAMPRIVGALGGFSMLTWLVTAYMLTSTASVPVYGKLSDLVGRKVTFTIGAVIFVTGSALCGLAQSMPQLIFFRAVQGLGAGAIIPTVQTIIGDIFTPQERAKFQGWFSAVWGFSALIGPLAGGVIVDHFTWRWLFYINLPLGILALIMVWRYLEEKVQRRPAQVDYLGAVTLTGGISCLLLLLLTGGSDYPWASPQIALLGLAAVLLLSVFLWQEQRAPDPMLPLGLFRIPGIGLPVLASFMIGGVLYGFTIYLPIWVQGVQGFSATRSGASLLWLSIAWSSSAFVGGRVAMKMGVRPAALVGTILTATGAVALAIVARTLPHLPEVVLAALTFVVGSGLGFSTLAFILAVQHSVDWSRRGVATASIQFLRTLGGLVWVAAMGSVMNVSLFGRVQGISGMDVTNTQQAGLVANSLLDPRAWSALPLDRLGLLREALADSLRNVHLLIVGAAVLALAVTLFIPNLRFTVQGPVPVPNPPPIPSPEPARSGD